MSPPLWLPHYFLEWKFLGTRSLDESMLNKTIQYKESKKAKPQHTLYLAWSTAILPSSGDSLRRRCEKEERNHEMPSFSSGPDPHLPPMGRSEEFKLSWTFLVSGKKSAVQDQNLSWHHRLTTGTHTETLAHLRAAHTVPQNYIITFTHPHSYWHPVYLVPLTFIQPQLHTCNPHRTQS